MTPIYQPAVIKPIYNRMALLAIGFCLALITHFALHTPVRAEETEVAAGLTLIVDLTDDVADAVACDPGVAKDCSLRGAVIKAAFNPGSTISLVHGQTYVLSFVTWRTKNRIAFGRTPFNSFHRYDLESGQWSVVFAAISVESIEDALCRNPR